MFWMLVAGCIIASPSTAEPVITNAIESTLISDLKALEDPTILSRRVWLDTEWSKYRDGSSNIDETLGVLWAWGIATDQDGAIRFKLPYKWHLEGDDPGDRGRDGIGDLKLATGTAWRLNANWRAGGGVEVRLPTGRDELSENIWKLQEFGAVACTLPITRRPQEQILPPLPNQLKGHVIWRVPFLFSDFFSG